MLLGFMYLAVANRYKLVIVNLLAGNITTVDSGKRPA